MAYDKNVSTSQLTVDKKRKIWRITFSRSDDGVTSESILGEYLIDSTVGSPAEGNRLAESNWVIKAPLEKFNGISGFGAFFNGFINMINDIKDEYDSSGTLETGSIQQLK